MSDELDEDRLLTASEVAELAGLTRQCIGDHADAGHLPFVTVMVPARRYRSSDVAHWLVTRPRRRGAGRRGAAK